ncbi:putative lipase atg15 [Ceratobasidium sp. 423]|nr:putative lipase atg15 [Ceratobasidium sp. 423]
MLNVYRHTGTYCPNSIDLLGSPCHLISRWVLRWSLSHLCPNPNPFTSLDQPGVFHVRELDSHFLPRAGFNIVRSAPRFLGLACPLVSSGWLGLHSKPNNRCHLGQSIVYDTVTELHWSVDIRTHGIVVVIEQLLSADWSERTGKSNGKKGWWGRKAQVLLQEPTRSRLIEGINTFEDRVEVPVPKPEEDCVECYAWEFGDYMNDTIRK